jgi:hypothetical protein
LRITIKSPQEVEVLDNEGRDLTQRLHIRALTVSLEAGKMPTAVLECEISELIAELEPAKVAATLIELGVRKIKKESSSERPTVSSGGV